MSDLSAPIVQASTADRKPPRYERLPPWLLSTIVHMAAIIGLGLLHISISPSSNLQLELLRADHVAESEIETVGLGDLDVALQTGVIPASIADSIIPASSSHDEMLTSLEPAWPAAQASQVDAASLMQGVGEGMLSEFGGGKGYTSLFGLAGEGQKFVYVFDRSQSMNSMFTLYSENRVVRTITPLHSAKQELNRSLDALTAASQFQIVFYNDAPRVFGESHYHDQLYVATESNKHLAHDYVRQMKAQGFTNHLAALEEAFALDPDVIFLLTDGEAKDDLHPTVVRRIYKYCQRHHITINVVHFCNAPRPACTLIPLAEKTGGQHLFISLQSLAESAVDPFSMWR